MTNKAIHSNRSMCDHNYSSWVGFSKRHMVMQFRWVTGKSDAHGHN